MSISLSPAGLALRNGMERSFLELNWDDGGGSKSASSRTSIAAPRPARVRPNNGKSKPRNASRTAYWDWNFTALLCFALLRKGHRQIGSKAACSDASCQSTMLYAPQRNLYDTRRIRNCIKTVITSSRKLRMYMYSHALSM